MPRIKRTVGFWRGPAQTTKIALLPAPDRFTGTPVDGWSPKVIHGMRRALLAHKREHPDIEKTALVAFANTWLHTNHPPEKPAKRGKKKGNKVGGTPRSVGYAHVQALLAPPPRRREKTAKPAEIDRTPRPSTLSGEEIAAIIRRNQSHSKPAAKKRTAPSSTATTKTKAVKRSQAKKPNAKRSAPSPKRQPPRAVVRADMSPRGPVVIWPAEVLDATRVTVQIKTLRHEHLCTVRAPLSDRYALFDAPAEGFCVLARFLTKDGKTVAEGQDEHRPSGR